MDFKYSLNDIATKCGVSIQSLYKLMNKNKPYFNNNSTRIKRKVYYNQTVMDYFVSYYLPEETIQEGSTPLNEILTEAREAKETPSLNEILTEARESNKSPLDALKAENDALRAEIDALRKQLDDKEAERLEMFRQNSALLLMLQQEKQEKMLLLPQPRKSLGDKVKALFKK